MLISGSLKAFLQFPFFCDDLTFGLLTQLLDSPGFVFLILDHILE